MIYRRLLLLSAGLLSGCSYNCTLLPCLGGLRVNFSTMPIAPFHVDARASTGGAVISYDCPDVARCNPSPFFSDFVPESAVLAITYQGRTSSTTVRPSYDRSYPNGTGCGGGCEIGTVTVPLP